MPSGFYVRRWSIEEAQEKTIVLLKEFHLAFDDPNAILLRLFKNLLQHAKSSSKTLIILGCRLILPPELERELTVVEFALPGKDQLLPVLNGVLESASLAPLAEQE